MNFQLRYNLLITIFIIVIIAVMWLLIQGLSYSFEQLSTTKSEKLTDNQAASQEVVYLEKIDNFALQEFDAQQKLSHFIKADQYFNFKNSPALLINPVVTTYDDKGILDYVLSSKRAYYLDNGDIKFKGEVDIRLGSGITHRMNTQELLVGTKTEDLISHKKVTYLGEGAKIISQGMHMKAKEDKLKLTGDVKINQDSGQKILTRDLYIDQADGQKHYYSDNATTYLSQGNKIYAAGIDMDMKKKVTQLLGKVKILQNSGSTIDTQELSIEQANGMEVYKTHEKIHYQSDIANIHAVGMNYDALKQKIKLTGGVVGRYE